MQRLSLDFPNISQHRSVSQIFHACKLGATPLPMASVYWVIPNTRPAANDKVDCGECDSSSAAACHTGAPLVLAVPQVLAAVRGGWLAS